MPIDPPTSLQPVASKEDYAELLADLSLLSRDLLLAFRLSAGKMFLDRFFAGSAHAYHDKSPDKEATFAAFAALCRDELRALGLSATSARQCILARIAWDGLPPGVRERLKFNHVVALARVAEPTTRARLAVDATAQGWTVVELEDAIHRAGDGRYYDTDASTPGTQPPAGPVPKRAPQPGRLVNQLVKADRDLQTWRQAWATADVGRLRGPQRQRLAAAVAALKAQIAELEAGLGRGR